MTMRMILRLMTAALMAAAAGVARADIVLGVAGPMSGPNAAYGEQY
ncbi:MAG: branched-chain amino acid ABC transporter substrate-binding protein, partial [Mesorhizobium sp.]